MAVTFLYIDNVHVGEIHYYKMVSNLYKVKKNLIGINFLQQMFENVPRNYLLCTAKTN